MTLSSPARLSSYLNHATALIALGRLDEAEAALDRVIELAPGDGDAWYNRATLRRQTPQRNHVAQIEPQLPRTPDSDAAFVPMCPALPPELDALGRHAASFAALHPCPAPPRLRLPYRGAYVPDPIRLNPPPSVSAF